MQNANFIKPQYESRCFSNIPQTVKALLTGSERPSLPPEVFGRLPQKYETVIVFFADSFGWRFFEKYGDDYPFLQHLTRRGVVSRLTSQYPSTTPVHVTTIHTGLPPGQSGIFEWQYYEPQLDTIITPLLFSFAGTMKRDTLKPTGIDPKKLYPTGTIYQELKRHGITSYLFQHRDYTPSTFSDVVFAGAEVRPYKTLPEALANLGDLLARPRSTSYIFVYYDPIDTICHTYGPDSPQAEAEIDTFLTVMDRLFRQKLAGRLKNTLFMMIADHGQMAVDPETTIYLNLRPEFSGLEQYFKTNRKGELIVPGGSPRDMFLYIKEGLLEEARAFLARRLAGRAEVWPVPEMIEQGFFGPPPISPAFLGRVGNLVILPYANEAVWWYEKDKFEQNMYGHHGGLTPEEMEIPIFLYDLST